MILSFWFPNRADRPFVKKLQSDLADWGCARGGLIAPVDSRWFPLTHVDSRSGEEEA